MTMLKLRKQIEGKNYLRKMKRANKGGIKVKYLMIYARVKKDRFSINNIYREYTEK